MTTDRHESRRDTDSYHFTYDNQVDRPRQGLKACTPKTRGSRDNDRRIGRYLSTAHPRSYLSMSLLKSLLGAACYPSIIIHLVLGRLDRTSSAREQRNPKGVCSCGHPTRAHKGISQRQVRRLYENGNLVCLDLSYKTAESLSLSKTTRPGRSWETIVVRCSLL